MAQLLTINSLSIDGYQSQQWTRIVDDVSLVLHRGEVLGLIGESGAGKSTIGKAALGYIPSGCRISGGSIVFDGLELTRASYQQLRHLRGVRIAFVAQSAATSFNPAHTVMRQLTDVPVHHGVMSHSEAMQKAVALFRALDLPNPERFGARYPHQVSGGQLQRAMVAMAMMSDPDIIVFDEPTTALDVTTQIEVLAAVKNAIKLHGTAAIYITHDLAVASQICDRLMVLRHGCKVEEGPTRQLIDHPQKEYTKELLRANKHISSDILDPDSKNTVLDIRNISASYGSHRVLDNVSIKVSKGETVAIVGESGSGKSTLARVITGLLPQDEGSVALNGVAMNPSYARRPQNMLKRVQMIYQMPDVALNPRQKVKDIIGRSVEFFTDLTGYKKRDRVLELLEKIRLDERYLDRFPSELSGGEKQRVCLARALAAEPEIIICDEITSALDQLVAKDILTLLQDLQREFGTSFLFITHDFAAVARISHLVVVMHHGKIVEQGPRNQVLTKPLHAYTKLLLSSVPEMCPDWLNSILRQREAIHTRQGNGAEKLEVSS
ncbi:hypothetical protein N182_27970 [Sinorhizobium sp. GL2]|nr:hypothetical protein N182_27970 [Sinorhizobium sp. GL2]